MQEDGKPFTIEAQYSYFLAKRAADCVTDAVRTGQATTHLLYVQLDLFSTRCRKATISTRTCFAYRW